MIVYQLTESQYKALLEKLELKRLRAEAHPGVAPELRLAFEHAVDQLHRGFHYEVVCAITGSG